MKYKYFGTNLDVPDDTEEWHIKLLLDYKRIYMIPKMIKMKTKNELLEEILHKSAEYKIPATILILEYLQYRYIGLQHYPAMQRIEMEYKSNIIFKRT